MLLKHNLNIKRSFYQIIRLRSIFFTYSYILCVQYLDSISKDLLTLREQIYTKGIFSSVFSVLSLKFVLKNSFFNIKGGNFIFFYSLDENVWLEFLKILENVNFVVPVFMSINLYVLREWEDFFSFYIKLWNSSFNVKRFIFLLVVQFVFFISKYFVHILFMFFLLPSIVWSSKYFLN